MISWFKNLWRKWFGFKTGIYQSEWKDVQEVVTFNRRIEFIRPAYDPSQDEERIMRGEEESYFD